MLFRVSWRISRVSLTELTCGVESGRHAIESGRHVKQLELNYVAFDSIVRSWFNQVCAHGYNIYFVDLDTGQRLIELFLSAANQSMHFRKCWSAYFVVHVSSLLSRFAYVINTAGRTHRYVMWEPHEWSWSQACVGVSCDVGSVGGGLCGCLWGRSVGGRVGEGLMGVLWWFSCY